MNYSSVAAHGMFFFNEPHKIVWVSIDITEKYKTTVLGDHRQKKRKKLKSKKKLSHKIKY